MRINEYDYGILQRAYEITGLQNEIMMTNKDNLEGMITTDALINLLEAMIDEYEHKADEVRELENKEQDEYDRYIDMQIDALREEELFGE